MARKSNTFLMLLCLLVASLLLITGGCDKGNGKSDPSNGDSPTVTTAKTDETTEPSLPEDTASTPASDPASPTDTTSTSKSNPTTVPLPALYPSRERRRSETERLEHFINLMTVSTETEVFQ